jgi:hypothetical protein
MAERVPELRNLPAGLVLDGEVVAFKQVGAPHWPLVCERVLHRNTSITVSFVIFDVLRVDRHHKPVVSAAGGSQGVRIMGASVTRIDQTYGHFRPRQRGIPARPARQL